MFCEKCGKRLDNGVRFCPFCGNPVDDAEDSLNNSDITAGMGYGFRQPVTEKRKTTSVPKNLDDEWEKEERKEKITFVVLGVIIVCLVVAIVAGIIFLVKSSGEKNDGERVPQLNEQLKEELNEKQKLQESGEDVQIMEDAADEVDAREEKSIQEEAAADSSAAQEVTPVPTQDAAGGSDQQAAADVTHEYMIPDSSTRYLSNADLNPLTEWEIRVARNEIYARHGRIFKSQDLADYFKEKSWYVPSVPPEQFDHSYLNNIEIENIKFITNYEKAHNLNQ